MNVREYEWCVCVLLCDLTDPLERKMLWLSTLIRNPGGISSCIRRCHFLRIGLLRVRNHEGGGVRWIVAGYPSWPRYGSPNRLTAGHNKIYRFCLSIIALVRKQPNELFISLINKCG